MHTVIVSPGYLLCLNIGFFKPFVIFINEKFVLISFGSFFVA